VDLVDLTDRGRTYVMKDTGYFPISNIRVLLLFEPEELAAIADYINRQLAVIGDPNARIEQRTNYQNLAKLLLSDRGAKGKIPPQPGLMSAIDRMSPAGRAKLMPGLKALLAGGLDKRFNRKRKGKEFVPQIDRLKEKIEQMISEHERRHGPVRACPVRRSGI